MKYLKEQFEKIDNNQHEETTEKNNSSFNKENSISKIHESSQQASTRPSFNSFQTVGLGERRTFSRELVLKENKQPLYLSSVGNNRKMFQSDKKIFAERNPNMNEIKKMKKNLEKKVNYSFLKNEVKKLNLVSKYSSKNARHTYQSLFQ